MDPTTRFSDRAIAYHANRPRYPRELLDLLVGECTLTKESVVADIGSGTGILTELFLRNGNAVHAIEPNAPMRQIAEENLRSYSLFRSVAATAEATGLAADSVDFIVAGQAFHWFDRDKAAAEFARILRKDGWIVLVWNERLTCATPFAAAYEEILVRHSVDYHAVNPKKVSRDTAAIALFLGEKCRFASFHHGARVTFDQLVGLLASASYAPLPGHPKHAPMVRALREAFAAQETNGTVPLDYETKIYYAPRLI